MWGSAAVGYREPELMRLWIDPCTPFSRVADASVGRTLARLIQRDPTYVQRGQMRSITPDRVRMSVARVPIVDTNSIHWDVRTKIQTHNRTWTTTGTTGLPSLVKKITLDTTEDLENLLHTHDNSTQKQYMGSDSYADTVSSLNCSQNPSRKTGPASYHY